MTRRRKNFMPILLFAILAAAATALQGAVCPLIPVFGVCPSLLPVVAAVTALYCGPEKGVVFGAVCGLLMDALTPAVGIWMYTAFLAVVCGFVGEISAFTYKSRMFSSVFWSFAVLVAVGVLETLVFGGILGGGIAHGAKRAAVQAVYSCIFAIIMEPVMRRMVRRLDF